MKRNWLGIIAVLLFSSLAVNRAYGQSGETGDSPLLIAFAVIVVVFILAIILVSFFFKRRRRSSIESPTIPSTGPPPSPGPAPPSPPAP